MLRQAENTVKIEGVLSEIDLSTGSYVKDGKTVERVSGTITIRVYQPINGKDQVLDIPVHMFANKYTRNNASNPAYENICKIMNEFNSIAVVGEEEADRVRITNGTVTMNEYYTPDGRLISFPRIIASFANRISKEECRSQAVASLEFMVANKEYEVNEQGRETGRYRVRGVIPQYGGKVDVITLYGVSDNIIDAISQYWNEGDTVKANCRLNFTVKTETHTVEVDFGEPQEQTRTVRVSDIIIVGGSQTPAEGEYAYDAQEIQAALAQRKANLEQQKQKQKAKSVAPVAPKKDSSGHIDLGF